MSIAAVRATTVAVYEGALTQFVGHPTIEGRLDGTGLDARLLGARSCAFSQSTRDIAYVTELVNGVVRQLDVSTGALTTFAGAGSGGPAVEGGPGVGNLRQLIGIFLAPLEGAQGALYVTDEVDHRVAKIDIATRFISFVAGSGAAGAADGVGAAAQFSQPLGITGDVASDLYVADFLNHAVRRIERSTATVSTAAGSLGVPGFADGDAASVRFDRPRHVLHRSIDGRLYVAADPEGRIRRVTIGGAVSTIVGDGVVASREGLGTAARVQRVIGMALDPTEQYLYAADHQHNRVLRYSFATTEASYVVGSGAGEWADSADPLTASFRASEYVCFQSRVPWGYGRMLLGGSSMIASVAIRYVPDAPAT